MKKKLSKAVVKMLPKTFRGASVVRGQGLKSDEVEDLLDRKALGTFDATRDMWIVVEDKALDDFDGAVEVKGFRTKVDAVRYAQSRASGNIDQRVLRITEQTLVIGTWNSL